VIYYKYKIIPKGKKFLISSKLKDKFLIKLDKNNPDYLIYNIFGDEHLNQNNKNSVKNLKI
jgi:hypothetical protein